MKAILITPENEIEVLDEEPRPSNFIGYLYRVDFDKDGNYNILYLS
jgi:hypothetical protein